MELFGSYTSPFVRHCRIALIQTDLPYEFIETDLSASTNASPTKKIPFLRDGDLELTDSSSILKYIREKSGERFFPDIRDYELFCLVNTAMDTSLNIFLFEMMDALKVTESKYLTRQQARVESSLEALEATPLPSETPFTDGQIRLACFLDWALYRQRFSLDEHPRLATFLSLAREDSAFAQTTAPEA